MSSRWMPLVLAALAVACARKRGEPGDAPRAIDASPAGDHAEAPAADAARADDLDAAPPLDAAAPPLRRYARVLHTGDSMVGGGLFRGLEPRFEAEGGKFYRDVWESGRIFQFADADRIPKLLKKIDPDLVIITLGANDVWMNQPDVIARSAEKIAKMVTDGGRDCWWLGPPIWKPYFKGIVELLREHTAPCRFFDASNLDLARRPDGIHPNEKGGQVWADAVWRELRPGDEM